MKRLIVGLLFTLSLLAAQVGVAQVRVLVNPRPYYRAVPVVHRHPAVVYRPAVVAVRPHYRAPRREVVVVQGPVRHSRACRRW